MLIIGIILIVIGLLLIVSFINRQSKCRKAVEATVSSISVTKLPARGRTVRQYTPVLSYTEGGQKYTQKTFITTYNKDAYAVGQKVTAYIDPKHPDNMRFGSNLGFLFTGIVILAVGVFIVIVYFM